MPHLVVTLLLAVLLSAMMALTGESGARERLYRALMWRAHSCVPRRDSLDARGSFVRPQVSRRVSTRHA